MGIITKLLRKKKPFSSKNDGFGTKVSKVALPAQQLSRSEADQ